MHGQFHPFLVIQGLRHHPLLSAAEYRRYRECRALVLLEVVFCFALFAGGVAALTAQYGESSARDSRRVTTAGVVPCWFLFAASSGQLSWFAASRKAA